VTAGVGVGIAQQPAAVTNLYTSPEYVPVTTSRQSNLHRCRTRQFSRIHQVAPMCIPYSTPQLASTPYWCCPLLSCFDYVDRRVSPGLAAFCLQNCRFTCGIWTQMWTWAHPGPHTKRHLSWLSHFAVLTVVRDRPRYFVCILAAF